MTQVDVEIQLIALVVAVSCALPGVFLVLRRMALMSDAISHTVLLGIVLAFFVTGDITSPFLIAAAAATGVLTVALIETLYRTRLVKQDAAIGLVFPALFSAAVILISRYAGAVHLDTDAVLLGELAFAPFRRLVVAGVDIGPKALYVMSVILLLNVSLISVLYKELKLSTFDPALAASLGFSPVVLHYVFMGITSVTVVGAFDAVGSILVVALMIVPPATAYLLTERLRQMVLLSALLGGTAAIAGYWVAWLADASIAGSMAAMAGAQFLVVFLFGPRGVLAQVRLRARQRLEFAQLMLAIHLLHHEGTAEAESESRESHLHEHLRWTPEFARRVVRRAERAALIEREASGRLRLTPTGRESARGAIVA